MALSGRFELYIYLDDIKTLHLNSLHGYFDFYQNLKHLKQTILIHLKMLIINIILKQFHIFGVHNNRFIKLNFTVSFRF